MNNNLTLIIPEDIIIYYYFKADEGASRKLPFYSLRFLNNIFRNYESKVIIHRYHHHVSQNRASKHSKYVIFE